LHIGATEKNDALLAKASAEQVINVNPAFVALKPELAADIFARNAGIAGTTVELDTSTPEAMATAINQLADEATEAGKVSAGELVGYDYDAAFPVLVRNLIKPYPLISWFVLAALCGAVISSLASMLNSASTIATMDLYAKFTGTKNPKTLVLVGRIFVVLFVILAGFVAPELDNFASIFAYIQEFQGFISPGILGWMGILLNVISYGAFKWFLGPLLAGNGFWYADQIAFLDRMAICFFIVIAAGILLTIKDPLKEPVKLPVNDQIELKTSKGAMVVGVGVVIATAALYYYFW